MAKDDQPGAHVDVDPEDPEGKGIAVPETEPSTKEPQTDPEITTQDLLKEQKKLYDLQIKSINDIQTREANTEAQTLPMYQSLLREMAQPLPQAPSMTEQMPYGPPPDQQSQRQGILGGIMYGLIGLGLAKIFAGKNKYAYYGAIDGLGQALQQRNANQREDAEKSFDRWLKLNQLWHEQLKDRYDDYKTQLENRRLTEQQKLDMIHLIADQHGNIQTAAAARSGDIEKASQQIEHLGKMIQASENSAWKVKQAWLRQMGHGEAVELYKSFLGRHGVNANDPDEWASAQRDPKLNFENWWETDYQPQKKYRPEAGSEKPRTMEEKESQENTEKEIQEHVKSIIGGEKPAAPETAVTPSSGYGLLPSQ